MYKRLLLAGFLMLSLILSPFTAAPAKAVVANTLIKIDGSPTVYWYANDGRRYVFPNPRTFYSWFSGDDLNRVVTVSPYELGSISLGGNVTYRPGVRLIKVTTDPRVYAVGRYGTLRWITSEALAQQLYGQNWAQQIDDVPDEFFTNYRLGDAVYNASQFNVPFEMGQARSPSENIASSNSYQPQPQLPPLGGIVNFSISNTQPVLGETITLNGNALNVNELAQNMTISLINGSTGQTLRSCVGILPCVYNLYVDSNLANAGTSQSFYARVTSINGRSISSPSTSVQFRGTNTQGYAQASSHSLTFSQSSVRPGDSFTVTSRLTPDTNSGPYYTIRIYDQWNVLQHTCERVRTCVLQQTLSATADTSRTYYAVATADTGHSISSGNATIQVISSSASENGRLGTSQLGLAFAPASSITVTPELTVYSGTNFTLSADLQSPVPSNLNGITIRLYQADGILLHTCTNLSHCAVDKVLTNAVSNTDATFKFYARVDDAYGTWYQTPAGTIIVRASQQSMNAFSATWATAVTPSVIHSNEPFTLKASIGSYNSLVEKLVLNWYQEDGALITTCYAQDTCDAVTSYPALNGDRTLRFYFTAADGSGTHTGMVTSALQTVFIKK